jgi:hypothetical protein
MIIMHRGVCRTFADADPALCADNTLYPMYGFKKVGSPEDPDVYMFEETREVRASDRYDVAVSKICRFPRDAR